MSKAAGAADKERVDTINRLLNNMGQMLLTVCDGDWDLALSVSGVLFASCCAQAAIENGDEPLELFEEAGAGFRAAAEKFYAAFAAERPAGRRAERRAGRLNEDNEDDENKGDDGGDC